MGLELGRTSNEEVRERAMGKVGARREEELTEGWVDDKQKHEFETKKAR